MNKPKKTFEIKSRNFLKFSKEFMGEKLTIVFRNEIILKREIKGGRKRKKSRGIMGRILRFLFN